MTIFFSSRQFMEWSEELADSFELDWHEMSEIGADWDSSVNVLPREGSS